MWDYDYRSYFNSIEDLLSDVYQRQGEELEELRSLHEDINTKLDTINNTMLSSTTIISALIVLSAAIKVIFR